LYIPLLLLASARPTLAQQTSREQEVRTAALAFGGAFAKADVSVLKTMLTTDYIHVNGSTGDVLSRDEWLIWVTSRRTELDRGVLVIDSYKIEDVIVQVYGKAAAVTGVVHSSGRRNGASFASSVRFTNVWVEQGGVWRRTAFHDSPLPEPES
jgi:ketosteroid isomerase-like protein